MTTLQVTGTGAQPHRNRKLIQLDYAQYCIHVIGQRHAKRDIRTYAKSVDPDQPQRLRRSV